MNLRVIAGEYRSRILKQVEHQNTRETKDRVKESIFNSLSPHLFDAVVLDLFSGSGSLGIEALSRGSKSCVFVDQMVTAIDVIKENIKTLGCEQRSEIFYGDYLDYLSKTYHAFDVILLDPPYKLDVIDDIIKTIARKRLLSENGVIVCLYDKNNALKEENNGIIEYKKKTMGITNVSFMKWGS